MVKNIITISLLALLTGCVTPVSSGCAKTANYENPHNSATAQGQNCSEIDAAIYLASALYMAAKKESGEEESIEDPNKGDTLCSGLIGRSQKECQRKEESAYDPLDEL